MLKTTDGVKPEIESPATSDVKDQESSTEQLEQGVKEADDTKAEETDATKSEEVAEPPTETENEEQEEVVAEEVEEQPKTEEAVPYERFKEVNAKYTELESKWKTAEPQVARMKVIDDYMQQHGIRGDQLQSAFEYLKFVNSDPREAHRMLKPTYEKLAEYVGERLPSDLQDQVAAGTLAPELAKEIARSRAENQYRELRQQAQQGQNQQVAAAQKSEAVGTWATSKQSIDPDFRPSTTGQDGKWEYVHKELIAQGGVGSFETPAKAIAATEAAYDKANKFFAQFQQKKTVTKKPITSTSSQQNVSAVVRPAGKGGEADIVRAIMQGKKPHQLQFK